MEALKVQLERSPRPFPTIAIKRKVGQQIVMIDICFDIQVENIEDFKFEDFEVSGYDPHPKIAMDMAV